MPTEEFKCPYCDFSAKTQAGLSSHIKHQHPEELKMEAEKKIEDKKQKDFLKAEKDVLAAKVKDAPELDADYLKNTTLCSILQDFTCEINRKTISCKRGEMKRFSKYEFRILTRNKIKDKVLLMEMTNQEIIA